MKKVIIILFSILILSLAILTTKASIVETFSNKKEFKKLVNKLDRQYNISDVKDKCKIEYDKCLKSESARKVLIDIFKNYDIGKLMLLKSPKEVVDLRECVLDFKEF